MDQLLNDYIENKKANVAALKEKEKIEFLLKEGLFYKEYSPFNRPTDEFPEWDWNEQKYYRKVTCFISDEEYEQLLNACNAEKEATKEVQEFNRKVNGVAVLLKVIAVITYIAFFILGIVYGDEMSIKMDYDGYSYEREFNFAVMFTYWAIGFISGSFTLGFAEIIKLLEDIKNKKQ